MSIEIVKGGEGVNWVGIGMVLSVWLFIAWAYFYGGWRNGPPPRR